VATGQSNASAVCQCHATQDGDRTGRHSAGVGSAMLSTSAELI